MQLLFRSLGVFLLLAVPTLGQAAPVPVKAPAEVPAQKVRKDLEAPVTVDLASLPLPQAISLLKEKSGVDLVLDRTVVELQFMERTGNGMENTQVSTKFNRTPLRKGLRSLLSEFDLTHVIIGDQVLITTRAMAPHRMLRQPVSIDVEKTTFADALKNLAKETATNVVLDPRAAKEGQEKVTLNLEEVPLETVIKLLAEQANLKVVIVDNVLLVTTKARATELREDPDFKPKAADPNGFPTPDGTMPGKVFPGGVLPVPPGGMGMGAGGGAPNVAPEMR